MLSAQFRHPWFDFIDRKKCATKQIPLVQIPGNWNSLPDSDRIAVTRLWQNLPPNRALHWALITPDFARRKTSRNIWKARGTESMMSAPGRKNWWTILILRAVGERVAAGKDPLGILVRKNTGTGSTFIAERFK
jgi:hypothetical protein